MKKTTDINNIKLNTILDILKKEFKKIYGNSLKDIILYGSYARGDYSNYSDIDIMILLNKKDNELKEYRKKMIEAITDISIKYDVVISVVDKNYSEFLKYVTYVPFYKNVYTEGIEIYGS